MAPPELAVHGCGSPSPAPSPAPAPTPIPPPSPLPQLFMDKQDILQPYGRIRFKASTARQMPSLKAPPLNYTDGATVFATFHNIGNGTGSSVPAYEVYAAVGRPGEPISDTMSDVVPNGVSVLRFTSDDLITYSSPLEVLYLENGSGATVGKNDGSIWTVKSLDRSGDGPESRHILFASYGSTCHSFVATDVTQAHAFKPTTANFTTPNFKDHDDTNVFYHRESGRWIDMQIMYEVFEKKYCDNVRGARRVITVRDSKDGGVTWSDDWGCLDRPQKDEHCKTFNTTAMVRPNDAARHAQGRANDEDPPELEFYRIRPFMIGDRATGRLAAHVLLYVPTPSDVVVQPGYGRQPLWYCKDGCCHGPHMYEEWWIGPRSGDPTDMAGWRRPFFDTHAFPHDVWAMGQPVSVANATPPSGVAASDFAGMGGTPSPTPSLVWLSNGLAWGVPQNRLAGLNAKSNAEFTTFPFPFPLEPLWIDADALWGEKPDVGPEWCAGGCNGVGGSDEAHAAYIMAELRDAATDSVVPGYERGGSLIMNAAGSRLPLDWPNASSQTIPVGHLVMLRFYFRDATIYALGSGT